MTIDFWPVSLIMVRGEISTMQATDAVVKGERAKGRKGERAKGRIWMIPACAGMTTVFT